MDNIKDKLNKRWPMIICVFVVVGLALLIYSVTRPPGPQKVAQEYMEAMQNGDYTKAYKLTYCNKTSPLLNERNFAAVAMKIDNFTIDYRDEERQLEQKAGALIGDNEYLASARQDYAVRVGYKGQISTHNLILVNRSADPKKPDWKVDISDYVNSYTLEIGEGPSVKVAVDGIEMPVNNCTVELNGFKSKYTANITGKNIRPATVTLTKDDWNQSVDLLVSSALQSKLEKVIDGFNKADVLAITDLNMDHYKPYIKMDGVEGYNNIADKLEDKINDLKDNNTKINATLKSIKYEIAVFENQDTVKLKDTEAWDNTMLHADGTTEHNTNTINWTYILEKQNNGTWLITEGTAKSLSL